MADPSGLCRVDWGSATCFPNLAEDLGGLQHARLMVVFLLCGGALEVQHIELQLTAQLGIRELQSRSVCHLCLSIAFACSSCVPFCHMCLVITIAF